MWEPLVQENEHGPYPFQSPEILADNAFQAQHKHPVTPHPRGDQTQHGDIYQMVYQYRNIMTLVYVFAHANILRPKGRGIKPESD